MYTLVVHNTVATTKSPLLSMHMHNKNSIHIMVQLGSNLFGGRECRALLRTLGCVLGVSGEKIYCVGRVVCTVRMIRNRIVHWACSPGSVSVSALGRWIRYLQSLPDRIVVLLHLVLPPPSVCGIHTWSLDFRGGNSLAP